MQNASRLSICGGLKAFGAAAILALMTSGAAHASGPAQRPVPAITIYPGESIRADWIIEREFPDNFLAARGALVESRSGLIGKVARRTLLPGLPIPLNAISEPKLVLNGAKVRIVYDDDGVAISAYGSALQAGAVGERVSVRNSDSGVIVTGIIQPDGSIRVSGS